MSEEEELAKPAARLTVRQKAIIAGAHKALREIMITLGAPRLTELERLLALIKNVVLSPSTESAVRQLVPFEGGAVPPTLPPFGWFVASFANGELSEDRAFDDLHRFTIHAVAELGLASQLGDLPDRVEGTILANLVPSPPRLGRKSSRYRSTSTQALRRPTRSVTSSSRSVTSTSPLAAAA